MRPPAGRLQLVGRGRRKLMRFAIVLLTAAGLLAGSAAAPLVAHAASSGYALTLDDQQQPGGRLEVDIDTDRGGAWYTSPMWIAIGVIALVLLIVLIVMATRGGGTTIVRE
jgi:hypothetical protein